MLINMKKFFTRFAAIAMTLVAAFSFVACEDEKVDEVVVSDATVEVAVTAKTSQSATFAITSTNAEAVAYYRTTDTKFIATGEFVFKNGKEVAPNTTAEVEMPYLENMEDYRLVVAARATNGAYTVTNTDVHVPDHATSIAIKVDSVACDCIHVVVTPDDYTQKYVVGVGPATSTVEDFLAGEVSTLEVQGNEPKTVSLDGLLPEQSFMVYAQSYNHEGPGSEVVTLKVTTTVAPAVAIEAEMTNTIVADLSLTPNDQCGAYSYIVVQKATWEEYKVMFELTTDEEMLEVFYMYGMTTDATETEAGQVEMSGMCDDEYIVGAIVFDVNNNYYGMQFKEFKSPSKDANAPVPAVAITVGEVTAETAELGFAMSEGTAGYYAAVMTAYDYESILANGESNLMNYVYGFGVLLTADDNDTWKGLNPEEEYKVVALPFNVNGADGGFGAMAIDGFTTEAAATTASVANKQIVAPKRMAKYTTAEQLAQIKK